MRLGLLLAALGYLVVGLSTSLGLAAVGMVIGGLGTFAFVPTLQAYLSTRLPFNKRARGLGTLDTPGRLGVVRSVPHGAAD